MTSSLGLLSGYCSDNSDNSNESFEMISNKATDKNAIDNNTYKEPLDNEKTSVIVSSTTRDNIEAKSSRVNRGSDFISTTSDIEAPHLNITDNVSAVQEKGKSISFFNATDSDIENKTSSEEESESDTIDSSPDITPNDSILPLPQLSRIHSGIVESLPGSVFSNPYKEAEENKRSVLEHHVSLGPSDIEKKGDSQKVKYGGRGKRRYQDFESGGDLFDDKDSSIKSKKVNRKKVGIASGLVPSQKYMKLHEQQQAKERPWTLKK